MAQPRLRPGQRERDELGRLAAHGDDVPPLVVQTGHRVPTAPAGRSRGPTDYCPDSASSSWRAPDSRFCMP